jgi:hypothetical protein
MNREEHLNKTFPLEDGTTYIENLDRFNSTMCEYSGLPNVESYGTNPQTQAEGAGVGGESLKEIFIDSESEQQSKSASSDWMYNWIRKHSNK